jgi:HAD superfamily hydrolase (TIGR01509 family)
MIARDDIDLVIFDCDGVLLNTEEIASAVCVEALADLGMHLTLHQYAARYSGRPVADAWRQVESDLGKPLPEGFRERVDAKVLQRFSEALEPIDGVVDLLSAMRGPRCVASSTTLDLLRQNLARARIVDHFAPSIFSVSQVKRGKPAPDVFLFAASQMGADPHRCLVIEDSAAGVAAGKRAGMHVIGFSGGGHATDDHAERLTGQGAGRVVRHMRELHGLLG